MFTKKEGDRPNIPDILILYTDGAASDKNTASQEAEELKKRGVTLICVGFGDPLTVQKFLPDLEKMASPTCNGSGKLVFSADFDDLDKIVDSIVKEACNCA